MRLLILEVRGCVSRTRKDEFHESHSRARLMKWELWNSCLPKSRYGPDKAQRNPMFVAV